jgi:hypothetical protein
MLSKSCSIFFQKHSINADAHITTGKQNFAVWENIHGKGTSEHGKAFAVFRHTAKVTRQKIARQRIFAVCLCL